MGFGTGFITGLAKAVDRSIRDDMDELKEQTSMLSKVRYERGLREHERYNEEMKNNLDVIKDMSRKVGSVDSVQYLIDRYGYAEAQNVANLLYERKNKSGGLFDIQGALGLEQRKGDSVSAKQLAEFVTPAMSLGKVTDLSQETPGMMKLFGADITSDVKARSDKMLSAAGVPTDLKTSVGDMPETLKGRGIREWELYSLDEPVKDARRLMSISQTMYKEALESGNKDMLAEAYEVRAAADSRLFEAKSLENEGTAYNDSEVRQSMSNLTALLAAANGVGDKGSYQGGVYTTGSMATNQATTLSENAAFLTEVGSEARSAGVTAAKINAATEKAISENRTLIFTKSDDPFVRGGTFSYGDVDSLIANRSTLFPTTATGQNVQQPGAGSNNAVNPPSSVSGALASQKAAYQGTNNQTQRQQIIQSLTRVINPATGKNFTAAEAQQYLES